MLWLDRRKEKSYEDTIYLFKKTIDSNNRRMRKRYNVIRTTIKKGVTIRTPYFSSLFLPHPSQYTALEDSLLPQ